ncbi:DUF541 domain-containing protein [Hymenobacter lapidiphilus]|uniref:SIMPL domain-containing protein n=1 Tax=Hymenobacter sp. CCM 8763 TaxID=2303334 RepID=UPI000E345A31|nr:SIMPL domain-containing protein [Hymenobacter sp. CCM 8763]RFP65749.1 DUF541 domain-containing protein [Hymenobacter sp. CCM 8763]
MRLFLPLSALLLAGCAAPSPVPNDQRPHLEVAGVGEVKSYPDQAEITVEVSFTKPRLKESVAEVQAVINDVMATIQPFVRTKQDIRTSFVSTNKEYTYRNDKQVFDGFQATQSLTVQLQDLTRLEAFMEKLLATRISRIKRLSYSHTQADSLQQQANLIALRNSLKAADKLCVELGQKRGPVLQVAEMGSSSRSESGWSGPVDMELYGKSMGGRSFSLTPELMTFSGQVQTKVALE